MENRDAISDETLDRFLAGELGKAERERVTRWLRRDPAAAQRIDTVLGSMRNAATSDQNVDHAWSRLRDRIASEERSQRAHRFAVPYRGLIAAGIAFVALGGLWITKRDRPAETASLFVTTGPGENRTISLKDGSKITLGPRSSVHYSEVKQAVSVVLSGMAGFAVIHNEKRHFSVAAGNARVVDLGTEFAVQAYDRDSSALVFVKSGKVDVGSPTSSAIALGANQGAAVFRSGAVARADDLAWQIANYDADLQGRLSFERRSIESIAHTLENWYGVSVIIPDPTLRARRITAMIQRPSLTRALEAIAVTTGSQYTIRGDTVILTTRHP